MKKIPNSYKKSGVNISKANKFVDHIARISKKMSKKRNTILKPITLVVLDQFSTLVILK